MTVKRPVWNGPNDPVELWTVKKDDSKGYTYFIGKRHIEGLLVRPITITVDSNRRGPYKIVAISIYTTTLEHIQLKIPDEVKIKSVTDNILKFEKKIATIDKMLTII